MADAKANDIQRKCRDVWKQCSGKICSHPERIVVGGNAAKRSSAASAPSSTGHQRSSVSVMAHHTPPTKDAGGVSCMVLVARQRDRSPWSCSGYAQSPILEAAPYLSTPPQTRRHTPLVTVSPRGSCGARWHQAWCSRGDARGGGVEEGWGRPTHCAAPTRCCCASVVASTVPNIACRE